MIFPRHLTLGLSHNEHKSSYENVADYVEHRGPSGECWVSDEQRRKAIEADELWELQWYPDTPVGFCLKLAADLDVLLEWAERYAMDETPSSLPAK